MNPTSAEKTLQNREVLDAYHLDVIQEYYGTGKSQSFERTPWISGPEKKQTSPVWSVDSVVVSMPPVPHDPSFESFEQAVTACQYGFINSRTWELLHLR